MRWDAKKKKYVRADANDKKKIKTESGVWIPASYKSNRYAKWKERSKLAQMQVCYAYAMHIQVDMCCGLSKNPGRYIYMYITFRPNSKGS